jgi:hypothetical protein
MRFRGLFVLVLLALVTPACDGPTAGELSIELATPSSGDGAILFRVRTPSPREFGEVSATCPGCQAFSYRVSDSDLYCVVTGSLTSGPLARILVSDPGARAAYLVEILEVSGLDRRIRPPAGYELRLSQ